MNPNTSPVDTPLGRMCLTISFVLQAAVEAGTITEDQRRHVWLAAWSLANPKTEEAA